MPLISHLRSRPGSRSRYSSLYPAGALGLVALGACNAIFGIEPGLPGGSTGTGGGTTASGSGNGGSAGATATSTTSTSTSTGSGPVCGGDDAGAPKGTPIKLLLSGAPSSDEVSSLTYDAAGNLFVAGSFLGATFKLGTSFPHVGAPGVDDAYVVKLDPSGQYLWGQAFGGTQRVFFNAVDTDAAGNVYLLGSFNGTATFGTTSLTAPDNPGDPGTDKYTDVLIVSLDPQGNVRWAKNLGNDEADRGLRLAVDAAGNSYIAGAAFNPIDFGEGSGPVGDTQQWWSFYAKLDQTGKVAWVQPVGSWASDLTPDYQEYLETAIAVDGKGHAVIGGNFKGQVFIGDEQVAPVGDADAFVASLDASNGKVLWYRTLHQPIGDPAPDGDQWITALTVDPCSGDIYAAGCFTRGIDFEGQGGVKVTTGNPLDPDMFLVRLAGADGTPLWARAYGDTGRQEPASVRVGPDGTVLLAGFLLDAAGAVGVDFGPDIGFLKSMTPNPGPDYYDDAFLIALDSTGKGLWGKRLGDENFQRAYSVAVRSTGDIALGGIVNGAMPIGSPQPALMANGYDAFVARFAP
jgi:hypothetical protein